MTFSFTSGPAYVLYVLCIMGFALVKGATFDAVATALFGALVWYTGRRAYKQVKLANITMDRDSTTGGEDSEVATK
jgi:hypothetical protein